MLLLLLDKNLRVYFLALMEQRFTLWHGLEQQHKKGGMH
jgi:hypothetical protein